MTGLLEVEGWLVGHSGAGFALGLAISKVDFDKVEELLVSESGILARTAEDGILAAVAFAVE